MSNIEQLKAYLKTMEYEGTLILNKDSCWTMIRYCEDWLRDVDRFAWEKINQLSFNQWLDARRQLEEVHKLIEHYKDKIKK